MPIEAVIRSSIAQTTGSTMFLGFIELEVTTVSTP
jgi:hypothetical protein